MGQTLGPMTFPPERQSILGAAGAWQEGGREYSEATAREIDGEVKHMLEERLAHVDRLLRDKRPLLDRVSAVLLDREVIEGDEFQRLLTS